MHPDSDSNELPLFKRVYHHSLDIQRAIERVNVHYDGDARKVLDYSRGVIVFDEENQYVKFREKYLGDLNRIGSEDGRIVRGWLDRIHTPAPNGYQDYKVLLEEMNIKKKHIYTRRHLSATMLRRQYEVLPLEKHLLQWHGRLNAEKGETFVIVADNFNWNDENSLILITGFNGEDEATYYCQLRMEDKLRKLRPIVTRADELRTVWMLFGELMVVAGDRPDGTKYFGSPNLYSSILSCTVENEAMNWFDLGVELGLRYQAVGHPCHEYASMKIY